MLDKMKILIFTIFLILNSLVNLTHSEKKFLHIRDDLNENNNKPIVIKNTDKGLVEALSTRYKRDLSSSRNGGFKNITTKVSLHFSPSI